jgi:peptide chain release factor 3
MTFEFGGAVFNLLDTPGHEDFSEDTYRTLTAVDSAVMVIDAAKGIELQTKKLFEVCRLRNIPITTFINKVDREGQNAFELLDEIASTLALDICPMVWPVGMGGLFRGCYDVANDRLVSAVKPGQEDRGAAFTIPPDQQAQLDEDLELVRGAFPTFDHQAFSEGHLTPVYFGSALKDYSVRELLEGLVANAPAPQPRASDSRIVEPDETPVTGFVFKVQANMDPQHRDRIAFTRICSGKFTRGMKLIHSRTQKPMAIQAPIFFFAQDRSLAEEAYPGDIIGIPNHGTLRVGDTLTEGEKLRFTGIPDFAPEILRRVRLADPMKTKQMRKALEDLAEEGVTQVFRPMTGSDWIVGVVGALQLDVLSSRIATEYAVPVAFEPAPFETARWIYGEDQARLKTFIEQNKSAMSEDREGAPVYLVRNSWELNRMRDNFPDLTFSATRERR